MKKKTTKKKTAPTKKTRAKTPAPPSEPPPATPLPEFRDARARSTLGALRDVLAKAADLEDATSVIVQVRESLSFPEASTVKVLIWSAPAAATPALVKWLTRHGLSETQYQALAALARLTLPNGLVDVRTITNTEAAAVRAAARELEQLGYATVHPSRNTNIITPAGLTLIKTIVPEKQIADWMKIDDKKRHGMIVAGMLPSEGAEKS